MNTNLKAVVLPMAHAEATHVEAVEATCYEEGNIEYWYCEACGQAWLDADCTLNTNLKAVVTPAAHAEATHVAAKDATCQENGNIEYWYCEACGQTWLDADCTLNTNLKSVVTVGDHNYQGNVCTECGDCEYDVMFQSKTVDGVSYIRLVTYVDDLSNYSNVCFNVTVNGNTTSWNCEVAYSYLIAGYVAKIPNEVFGEDAEYFVLYTFGNAQNYAEYDMTVSVTWTAVDGTQVTSESRTVNVGELLAN